MPVGSAGDRRLAVRAQPYAEMLDECKQRIEAGVLTQNGRGKTYDQTGDVAGCDSPGVGYVMLPLAALRRRRAKPGAQRAGLRTGPDRRPGPRSGEAYVLVRPVRRMLLGARHRRGRQARHRRRTELLTPPQTGPNTRTIVTAPPLTVRISTTTTKARWTSTTTDVRRAQLRLDA
jgi:hypothetical protein